MASPYAWVGLSWFNTVEYQMRHMNRLFGELQRRGARTFEVTEQANARFLDRMTTLLDDSVFQLGSCATSRSYWFNHTGRGKHRFSGRRRCVAPSRNRSDSRCRTTQ